MFRGGLLPLRAHVQQIHKEVIAQGLWPIGKDPVRSLTNIRIQHAQTANQHRELGRSQRQQLRFVHQHFGCLSFKALACKVAKPVCAGFQHGEGMRVGLLWGGVGSARRKWDCDAMAGLQCSGLNRSAPAQHDQVGQRYLPATGLRAIEALLDLLQNCQNLGQFGGLIDFPILLRRQTNARSIGTTALVAASER